MSKSRGRFTCGEVKQGSRLGDALGRAAPVFEHTVGARDIFFIREKIVVQVCVFLDD